MRKSARTAYDILFEMFKKLDDLGKPTLLSKTAVKDLKSQLGTAYPFFA